MISEFSEESEYVIKVWDLFRFYDYGFIIEFPFLIQCSTFETPVGIQKEVWYLWYKNFWFKRLVEKKFVLQPGDTQTESTNAQINVPTFGGRGSAFLRLLRELIAEISKLRFIWEIQDLRCFRQRRNESNGNWTKPNGSQMNQIETERNQMKT